MGKPGFDQKSLKNTNLSFNFHLIGEIVIRKIWYRGSKHRFIMMRKHFVETGLSNYAGIILSIILYLEHQA